VSGYLFFISGLVIAQSFLGRTDNWNFGGFYIKRLIRIYPPYLFSLLVCDVVLVVIDHMSLNTKSYAASKLDFVRSGGVAGNVY
jgi:peptidoglycan/LPS O-acetylase OafA/YrhL